MARRALAAALLVPMLLVAPGYARAWSEQYSWAATPGATSYRVEVSMDNGATWALDGTGTTTTPGWLAVLSFPGLVLFRISACQGTTCLTRATDGLWHDESRAAPPGPTSLRVQ